MFNLQVLEHSFALLRPRHPSLALCIRNLTAVLHTRTYTLYTQSDDHRDTWVAIDLPAARVNEIVSALSDTAEGTADDTQYSKQEKIAIHRTLLAWMIYAQSFIEDQQPDGDHPPFARYS